MTRRDFAQRTAWAAGLNLVVAPAGRADEALEQVLDEVAPGLRKWVSVCVVTSGAGAEPVFDWFDYRGTATATDFWPASTIKMYVVVAVLEWMAERGFGLETKASFEHRDSDGRWVDDGARSVREMVSEVFRRSSNEDYTLLLRLVGIDYLNSRFLVAGKGFERSALMRGYVSERPWCYVREEPQRVHLSGADGVLLATHEHRWSGRFYAEERGATVLDARTGNVTSPRELVDCLRRVMYHEWLPEGERFQLTAEQLAFLRTGGGGLSGLETRGVESGPSGWVGAAELVFPRARFFHKSGVISNFALEVAAVDDSAQGGPVYLWAAAVAAGLAARPVAGEPLVSRLSWRLADWVRSRRLPGCPPGFSVGGTRR